MLTRSRIRPVADDTETVVDSSPSCPLISLWKECGICGEDRRCSPMQHGSAQALVEVGRCEDSVDRQTDGKQAPDGRITKAASPPYQLFPFCGGVNHAV